MHQYKLISRKGEGAFSEVLKAQSIKTGNYAAIKCMKTHFNSVEQVNQLREIQALRKLAPHPHIVKLLEILYDEPTGRLALVFELMEMNMYELIKDRKTYLPEKKVKHQMFQLFKAIEHMHRKGIFHRDIKPENILIAGDLVKLADLGSCRGVFGEHPYTEYISTRWYRSPECLMTDGYYDHKMDIWGAGCVMFEIMTLVPLFPGKNEVDMVHRIHNVLGTPAQHVLDRFKSHASHLDFNFPPKQGTGIEKMLAHTSPECVDLLKRMLTYDPEHRISAEEIMNHEYFKDMHDAERKRDFHSTMSSARLSPSLKQLQNDSDKSTLSYHEKEHYPTQPQKKKTKKLKEIYGGTNNKFPSLNVNLKVEGSFKNPGYYESSMDEDENNYKPSMLPQIKNGSTMQLDTKYMVAHMNNRQPKKKEEPHKKYGNTIIKPSMSNQYLYKKQPQKSQTLQAADYLVVGRKAG
jgi:renal tumor antigen